MKALKLRLLKWVLLTVAALAAAPAWADVVLPCPEAKPKFDHTKIDRAFKAPKPASNRPLYRFFAFGPAGSQIVALVVDESGGPQSGYDTFYIDLNANHDLTEPPEKFDLKAKGATKPLGEKGMAEDLVLLNVRTPRRTTYTRTPEIEDPRFDYRIAFANDLGFALDTVLKDRSWHTRLGIYYNYRNVWGTNRDTAPVWRFGGDEFTLGHEHLAGETLKPGTKHTIQGRGQFFAGCSPSLPLGGISAYVHGGYTGFHSRFEMADKSLNFRPVDHMLNTY